MWPEIVGPAIAAQAEEPHFKGDKLYVRVKNPAWRHEIHMQRYTIMVKLNQKVNEEIIKEVIVTS